MGGTPASVESFASNGQRLLSLTWLAQAAGAGGLRNAADRLERVYKDTVHLLQRIAVNHQSFASRYGV